MGMRRSQTVSKNHSQASSVHGSPLEIVALSEDRSWPRTTSRPARIIWRTAVGATPAMVTRCSLTRRQRRPRSGKSGAPSAITSVAPIRAALTTAFGPTIQPMSLIHKRRSPALRSMHRPRSRAFLPTIPQWVCTVPFAAPVVPEVYISMAGASASTTAVSVSSGLPATTSCHHTSRPRVIATSLPAWRRTTTVASVSSPSAASSSSDFIAITAPRRVPPSAVITALAPAAVSRSRSGAGPKPENIGMAIAPILATARNAAAVSGSIGM
jgi:hypothetical protein